MKKFTIVYGKLADELQEDFGAMQEVFMQYWKEFRNYREEFRNFTKRTDENFKLILNKYGEISEKLTIILETLVKESKETREMLNENNETFKRGFRENF
jgi:mevalonate kinase